MGVKQVHHPGKLLLGIFSPAILHRADKLAHREGAIDQASFDGNGKGVIIHGGVEFRALKITGSLSPDLGGGIGVGVDGFHQLIPLLPKTVPDLFGHIQSPAVDPVGRVAVAVGIHPAAGDGKNICFHFRVQVFASLFVRHLCKLRQTFDTVPTGPIELLAILGTRIGPGKDGVPVLVFRFLLLFPDIGKGKKSRGGVVKDSVNDHPHSLFAGFFHQLQKLFIGSRPSPAGGVGGRVFEQLQIGSRIRTKEGIHVVKNQGIVFVQGWGGEDRIEIQGGDPQVFQVVQLVDDSLEIPAVPAVGVGSVDITGQIPLPVRQGVPLLGPGDHAPSGTDLVRNPAVVSRGVVLWVSVMKSFRENLVPDRLLGPVWV